eukprot:GHVN01106184.1.p1 GENE.GHVN01106184.1~~GHVN01106184.1.p1  ORF type:complete len:677 (-),score=116.77 GHVN01106184.1:582-2612(-)
MASITPYAADTEDVAPLNESLLTPGEAREATAAEAKPIDWEKLQAARKRNIFYLLVYTFITTIGFSISQWNVFDAYLQELARSLGSKYSNSFVGIAESLGGFTSLLLALPVGIFVDKYSRTKICKWSSALGIVSVVWLGLGVLWDNVMMLFTALVLGGVYFEFCSSASDAIFADSAEPGKRSDYFTTKGILSTSGLAIGPGVIALLFYFIGDEWKLNLLHIPLLIGIGITPIGYIFLCLLKEPHPEVGFNNVSPSRRQSNATDRVGPTGMSPVVRPAGGQGFESAPTTAATTNDEEHILLENQNEGLSSPLSRFFLLPDAHPQSPHSPGSNYSYTSSNAALGLASPSQVIHMRSPLVSPASPIITRAEFVGGSAPSNTAEIMERVEEDERTAIETGEVVMDVEARQDEMHDNMSWQEKSIPFIVALSDLTRKIGAGMTTKFFPLFFINDYGFRPIQISLLYCAFPLSVSVFMRVIQKMSKPMGRAQAVSFFQLTGIIALIFMCFTQNIYWMVVLFLVRGGMMNCGFPIDRSIVNDYIPSRHRGKWNAVQSLTGMTWSGSAMLGGFLSDTHDYRYTFIFTAMIYCVALVIYLPLLWLVPRKEGEMGHFRLVQTKNETESKGNKGKRKESDAHDVSLEDGEDNKQLLSENSDSAMNQFGDLVIVSHDINSTSSQSAGA